MKVECFPAMRCEGHRATLTPVWLVAMAISGLIAAIVGFAILVNHSQTPGAKGIAPANWPHTSRLVHSAEGPTLVVFLHPHCPCGRATVTEVEKLIERHRGLHTIFVLLKPQETVPGWEHGVIRDRCLALKDVQVFIDNAGEETRLFDVVTSGHVCLYDDHQQLQYSGGVTQSRGHEGDNEGIDALRFILAGNEIQTAVPVFGCPLFSKCDGPWIK